MKSIGSLFDDEPDQMGLRGDRGLWKAMQAALADEPFPSEPGELQAKLEAAYQELTGQPLSDPTERQLPQFATGGMSSGVVCPDFWQNRTFPMVHERFKAKAARPD